MLSSFKKHLIAILPLTFLGFCFYRPALGIKPFDPDNLLALSMSAKSPAGFFSHQVATYFPGYRPLAQLSLWLQYQITGLNDIPSYFLVNVLIWIACAILIYFIVHQLTKSRAGAIVGSIAFLFDLKIAASIIWIGERQNVTCVFFGLLAILITIIFSSRASKIRYWEMMLVAFFLLASYLSKEFGLAFAVPIIIIGYLDKSRNFKPLAISVVLSAAIYFIMRFLLGNGGSIASYCEDMGFFGTLREVCYKNLNIFGRFSQYTYNAGATLVGTYFPFLFNPSGQFEPSFSLSEKFLVPVVTSLIVLVGNIWALLKARRKAVPFAFIVLGNAILSFALYRARNQLAGITGVYILFGIGFAALYNGLKIKRAYKIIIAAIIVCFIIVYRAPIISTELASYANYSETLSPCQSQKSFAKDISLETARSISLKYHLDSSGCVAK